MPNLFTFVMDFRGGTYVSQVSAKSLEHSLTEWTKNLQTQLHEIQFLGTKSLAEFENQLTTETLLVKPSVLNGLKNTWFIHLTSKMGSANVNIIKTEK